MNYLVIYPGRFHPFHRGHRASYEYLAKKYGEDHVYIATTGVQAPVTSPFTFADKVQMISTLGIPAGHVVKVSNPYQSREITDSIPSEEKANTVLIFALSAKDAERFNFAPKRDGTPSYLQPMPKNLKQLKPMTKHAYVEITPTVNFKVRGQDANSASQIREFYIKGNNNDRDQIIADLYGEAYPELRDIFDDRLGVSEQVQKIVREARSIKSTRSVALLEQILITERRALNEFAQGVAEAATDDPKFQKMLGNIQKNTPDPFRGYVAVRYASEKPSKKIKGATVNGKALPTTTDDPGRLIKDLKFTSDRIEHQLMAIGKKHGWDLIDPGQGQGYSELFFDTNREYTTNTQQQLATNIVKTVNEINKFFASMNSSLQATGLPGYQVNVWQGMGANGNTNQFDDINQITNIAKGKSATADPGPAIGRMILKYLPGYEAENDELGYDSRDFVNAKKVASIYIAKGERAGLQVQNKLEQHVSEMIDELLSDHGGSGLRTIWELDEQGVAEGREQITELRDRMYQYIKSIVPTWPDYVVKDWLYGNLATGETYNKEKGWSFETVGKGIPKILNDTGLSVNTTWQLVPNVKFTMDMWEPKTLKRLQARAGGSATSTDPMVHIPARDAERHATQAALAQQQGGVRKEPVIIVKTPQGYELLEGWHRTIQHFARYPNGYTGPAYVAVAQGQPGVAEGESPANTLYFFDVGRGGRSFTNVDLRAMGLRQSQSGKWYYRPGGDSTPLLLKTTLDHLAKQLNVPPKPWQRPQTNEGIRDVLNFGIKKPAVKPTASMDDFTAKMIANKQKNLKIVHPKDVYKSPEEYTKATGNKIKESPDYLEEK